MSGNDTLTSLPTLTSPLDTGLVVSAAVFEGKYSKWAQADLWKVVLGVRTRDNFLHLFILDDGSVEMSTLDAFQELLPTFSVSHDKKGKVRKH